MSEFKQKWLRLKNWQSAIWQPVLPPLGAVIELASLTALIMAVDWMFPSIGLNELEPSPYWLPVLLLSLQYGTVAGLLAAGVATAVYIFNGFPEQAIGENLFTYLLRIWALPMLWVGASLILGQFRLRQIEVKQNLSRDLDQRRLEAQSLAGYSKDLEARCHILERQLAINTASDPAHVLDALAGLSATDVDVAAVFDQLCRTAFPRAQMSVFAATPFGFACVAKSNWANDAVWAQEFNATHAMARAVTGERRTLSVLMPGDEITLATQGLVVQPIIAADTARVVGFIKIEAAAPRLIDAGIGSRLSVIARFIAPALTEPRIVINNDARGVAEAAKSPELTKGWRQVSWRVISANDASVDGTAPVDASAPASRPSRRK